MNPVPDIFRILPEVILTLTGVAIMLIDASLPAGIPRRSLGWIGALGTTLALWASLWQLSLPQGTGFFGTVETSAFTIFFHVLICGIVLVALLLSLDTVPEDSHHQGEFYALILFGAVGMCLMTGAVELLVVFIALEISSIATYVLAGFRKSTERGPESAIKYFLLGSFATAFFSLRNCADFWCDGHNADLRDCAADHASREPAAYCCGYGSDAGGGSVQGIGGAIPGLDSGRV